MADTSVAILLCTFNGARFLREQLDSYEAQTHRQWELWVSDDGSTDGTLELLHEYRRAWPHRTITVVPGPRRGFAANFLSLVCRREIQAQAFAFSDQDDVWLPDKLERALARLQRADVARPAVYCSRTVLVDEDNRELGISRPIAGPLTFANALVQNTGAGNTMVLNPAARALLVDAGPDAEIVAHDWWTTLLVLGSGGEVLHDPTPSVRYRQHGKNLMGTNQGLRARLHRLSGLMRGQLKEWNDVNTRALGAARHLLSAGNRETFDTFAAARGRWVVPRLSGLVRSGVRRQSRVEQVALGVAAALGKI